MIYIVMAYIGMAYMVMAYIGMAYIGMAYLVKTSDEGPATARACRWACLDTPPCACLCPSSCTFLYTCPPACRYACLHTCLHTCQCACLHACTIQRCAIVRQAYRSTAHWGASSGPRRKRLERHTNPNSSRSAIVHRVTAFLATRARAMTTWISAQATWRSEAVGPEAQPNNAGMASRRANAGRHGISGVTSALLQDRHSRVTLR